MFSTLAEFRSIFTAAAGIDAKAQVAASARNAQLTKPAGSLGRLEDVALWYAGWRGAEARPERVQVAVFAGNHGIAAQGVSAFPPEVTVQMVANFEAGGAAINQLAAVAGASFSVHGIDLDRPTGDITQGLAMDEADCVAALRVGWEAVDPGADLLVLGEMGIGNTSVAASLAAAIFGGAPGDWVGRGTGVDDAGLARKAAAVGAALNRHEDLIAEGDPLEMLAALGGREIAAMVGAMARARVARIPVVLDGFIASAAAAVLHGLGEDALSHLVAGHCSAEGAHGALLEAMGLEPLLRLGLRLGEGSGAALAVPIVKAAVACQTGMATFAEAAVAGQE